jgi:hypothetical protein
MLSFAHKVSIALMLCIALLLARLDPLLSSVHQPIKEAKTSTANNDQGQWEEWWKPITIFTALLVAVGFGQLGLFWRQYRQTKILQRAYLSVEPLGLHEMTDKSIISHIAIFNGGNLPAKDVRSNVRVALSDNGDKADFEAVTIPSGGQTMIVPKGKVERGTPELGKDGTEAYRGRLEGFFVYVWGRVEYEDGFDKSRWLIFCHRYNCAKPEALRTHHHHNDGN